MNPNAGEPINSGGAVPPVSSSAPTSPDLSNLESALAAAQAKAAQTPQDQFRSQFGPTGPATTEPLTGVPVKTDTNAETKPLTGVSADTNPSPFDSGVTTAGNLSPADNFSPTAESMKPPEQTPAEKLKKQIAISVDAFLEEVTRKKSSA